MIKELFRRIVVFLLAVIVLASSLCAGAINFDAEEAYGSIFVIISGNSLGSGFSIGPNCIITNAHVITDSETVTVDTYGGDSYDAFVVAMDQDLDIAVLGVDLAAFTPLAVGSVKEMSLGDDVYAIGAPNSLSYTLTKGCLSAKERVSGSQTYIQTDAAINSGNSGGPLLNNDGQVIGVNSYKILDAEGIGLAIPISTVISFLGDSGIQTDETGNVPGVLARQPEEAPKPTEAPLIQPQKGVNPAVAAALAVLLAVSVALNIVLAVLLSRRKKKSPLPPSDPRERTDFEIDIME